LDWSFKEIPLGKAEVLKDGKDLVIIAIGNMVYQALKAAKELEKEGISAAVINARFLKPLDKELLLEFIQKTGKVLTVEENALIGGLSSAVCELIMEEGLSGIKFKKIGLPDKFIEHGDLRTLRDKYGLNYQHIISTARSLLE